MYLGIKNVDKSDEQRYSSMTNKDKLNLKKRIMQDGISFSQRFSYSNFISYQNVSIIYQNSMKKFNELKKMYDEIQIDENKKKELLNLAQQNNVQLYYNMNTMYNDYELKYFERIIIPFVKKESEIKEIEKCVFNAYQNYLIYNNISQLWSEELEALNKFITFEAYRNKIDLLEDNELQEKKEKMNFTKIEKIKRRIKMHIPKNHIVRGNSKVYEEYM